MQGYRKKPFWIYSTVWTIILLPYLKLIYSNVLDPGEALIGLGPIDRILSTLSSPDWSVLVMQNVAAIMLLSVTQINYFLAFAAFLAVGLYGFYVDRTLFIVASVIPVFLITSSFRKPYLNRRLRWWTQAPRFEILSGNVEVQGYLEGQFPIANISRSGILLQLPANYQGTKPQISEKVDVVFTLELRIEGKIVRLIEDGFAIQFSTLSFSDSKKLDSYIRSHGATELHRQ